MVLMPKCPACVVAYVAIVTGAGISVSAAAHLRLLVLVLCVAVLVWMAVKPLLRVIRHY
jgi:threonine/homoserine/homoserine lactone efflux protein